MKLLNLVQGSDEWIQARLKYLCASEAPAMMGDSKFMSRNQLLALKKGWLSNPAGSFKQKLYDKGHESEEAARELLEFDLCEEIKSAVGLTIIDGLELLSSFDGLGDFGFIWEHKEWNETLAENVRNVILEPMYYWQLEHQMLTAGLDEVCFMVSDGTITKRLQMLYQSVPALRTQLISGWKQFIVDLDEYQLEAKQEKVVARKQDAFPSIECRVEGSVVISNLGDYIPLIKTLADEQMSLILDTDQDFADKDAFNKNVKEGRRLLKSKAIDIETEFESLATFNGYVQQADLILQKLQSHGEGQVKQAKATKKLSIINNASAAFRDYLAKLSEGINGVQITQVVVDFEGVMKGKRSFEKMEDAVNSALANAKIEANEISQVIRKNLDSLSERAKDHRFLFSDHAMLLLKDNDDLINLIKARISEHERAETERLENERKRIQAEEKAKAQREAETKAEQERDRIRKEERQKAEAEQKKRAAEEVETKKPVVSKSNQSQEPKSEPAHAHQAAIVSHDEPSSAPQTNIPNDCLHEISEWANAHNVNPVAADHLELILNKYFTK